MEPPAPGGAFGPTTVTDAVQPVLEREDNLTKLATGRNTARRELFVWLDEGSTAPVALGTPRLRVEGVLPDLGGYPPYAPDLPDPVARLWAATGPNDRDVLARGLWVTEGGKWTVLTGGGGCRPAPAPSLRLTPLALWHAQAPHRWHQHWTISGVTTPPANRSPISPITARWQPDYLRTPGGGDGETLLLW